MPKKDRDPALTVIYVHSVKYKSKRELNTLCVYTAVRVSVGIVLILLKNNLNSSQLVTSNFSFSHSVSYRFGELSANSTKFEIVVCKLFEIGRV